MFILPWIPLNNREEAITIWVLVLLVWLLPKRGVRDSLLGVFRAFMQKILLTVSALTVLYAAATIAVLWRTGFWNGHLIKDTGMWLIGTAFVLVMNSASYRSIADFERVLLRSIKLGAVLQFIAHLYVFPLLVELALVPFLFVMSGVAAVARLKKELAPAKKMADRALAAAGVVIIGYVSFHVLTDYHRIVNLDTLRAFLLPPLLTVPFLPFAYLLAVFSAYETLFVRLAFFLSDNAELAHFAKRRIFRLCLVNLGKLERFTRESAKELPAVDNKEAVLNLIHHFRENRTLSSA